MSRAEYPVCRTCGSNDVLADAYAEWDRENACWTVLNIYDKARTATNAMGKPVWSGGETRRTPPRPLTGSRLSSIGER